MLVLQESKNASHANYLINHPDTRAFMGDSDHSVYLDMSDALDDCIFLECNGGGVFYHPLKNNEFDMHCAFLEDSRGKKAKKEIRKSLIYIFTKHKASKVFARIPVDNKRTRTLSVHLGFERGEEKEVEIQGNKSLVIEYFLTKERFKKCLLLS